MQRIIGELVDQKFTLHTMGEFARGFRWFYLGRIFLPRGRYQVIINNLEDVSALAKLAVAPTEEFILVQELAFNIFKSSKVGYLFTEGKWIKTTSSPLSYLPSMRSKRLGGPSPASEVI